VLLEARGIRFSYKIDGRPVGVLNGLDLAIEHGEMVAIQGASGSGKSTLLYILGCLLRPDEGKLTFDGLDLSKLSKDELAVLRNRMIGFVFQQFHLLPRASVLENIMLPTAYPCEKARRVPEHRAKALELARTLGLDSHLEHLPNQLSGGQQQRVAIARALMNDTRLILADEPTGNLDTKNAAQILDLLGELNRRGKAVIIITHDPEVARRCSRIYHIRDGVITSEERLSKPAPAAGEPRPQDGALWSLGDSLGRWLKVIRAQLPMTWEDLRRNKARSLLTMLGITIGIAAVLAMLTLGRFTQQKILDSYESLGVNKLVVRGWNDWTLKAADRVGVIFRAFSWEHDLQHLPEVFPEIRRISPVLTDWNDTVHYNGVSIQDGVRVYGVSDDYIYIHNRSILLGHNFSPFQVEARSPVCMIGTEIAQRLFAGALPVGNIVYVTSSNENPYACEVVGVLKEQSSNNEWYKPNLAVLIPYTFFPLTIDNWWNTQIHDVTLQLAPGTDVEATGKSIKEFFKLKYGKSGRFSVDSDAVLIAQMKKFLSLFTVLLAGIALLSLVVGGIGITNMMLVSVSERFKEIGLRKALGATDVSVRIQFLVESVVLCAIAGLVGMALGFAAYEALIWGASKFVSKLHFEWVVMPGAVALSVLSIAVVGVASGLMPALKAERLEVIEALRSE
jgi:macrolide transport system ATP-binding/permease protein